MSRWDIVEREEEPALPQSSQRFVLDGEVIDLSPRTRSPEEIAWLEAVLERSFALFVVRYRPSFAGPDDLVVTRMEWREMLDDHPWITPDLFVAAEKRLRYQRENLDRAPFMPSLPEFLYAAREIAEERRHHQRSRNALEDSRS